MYSTPQRTLILVTVVLCELHAQRGGMRVFRCQEAFNKIPKGFESVATVLGICQARTSSETLEHPSKGAPSLRLGYALRISPERRRVPVGKSIGPTWEMTLLDGSDATAVRSYAILLGETKRKL